VDALATVAPVTAAMRAVTAASISVRCLRMTDFLLCDGVGGLPDGVAGDGTACRDGRASSRPIPAAAAQTRKSIDAKKPVITTGAEIMDQIFQPKQRQGPLPKPPDEVVVGGPHLCGRVIYCCDGQRRVIGHTLARRLVGQREVARAVDLCFVD